MTTIGLVDAATAFDTKAQAAGEEELPGGILQGLTDETLKLMCAGMGVDPEELMHYAEMVAVSSITGLLMGGPEILQPTLSGIWVQGLLTGRIWADLIEAEKRKDEMNA